MLTQQLAESFLSTILPSSGVYIAVVMQDDRRQQFVCETIEKLAETIISSDEYGYTTYHACASFKDPKGAWDERAKKYRKRSHANVLCLRCLFADLDCGEGKPYASWREAYEAVIAFCDRLSFPYPLLVCSGYGLHVYWLLDRDYTFEDWKPLAASFKAFLTDNGLKIDPARTSDASSILRTPGTHNRKRGLVAPVTVSDLSNVQRLTENDLQRFRNLAPVRARTHGARTVETFHSRLARDIVGKREFPPASLERITGECPQLARFLQNGNLPEPRWHACIGVTVFTVNGRERTHQLSAKDYPGYSYEETEDYIERALQVGPTTCKRFESLNSATCRACPHYGRIKSPISLGAGGERDERRTGEDSSRVQTETDEIPALKFPFHWGDDNGELMAGEGKLNSDDADNIVICDQTLFLTSVNNAEINTKAYSYRFRHNLEFKDGFEDIIIPAKLLHGSGGMAEMAEKGAVIHDPQRFMLYVRTTVDDYHKTEAPAVRYEQFGWKNNDSSFLFGPKLYTAGGLLTAAGTDEIEIRQKWLGPQKGGTIGGWTYAGDKLFANQMEAYSVAMLASAAAPLMKFANDLEGGCWLHFFNPSSGKGKSTTLQYAWTFWGLKDGLCVNHQATTVSASLTLAAQGNLPFVHDEILERDPDEVRKFIHTFSEGKDRLRGQKDGTIRHVLASWRTVGMSASNYSLLEILPKEGTDAAAFRVLELACELGAHDRSEGEKLRRELEANAGWAGDRFVKYLVAPGIVDWVKTTVDAYMKYIWERTNLPDAHRFRVRLVACIAVAGLICNKLDILHFNVDRILEYLIEELGKVDNKGTISARTSVQQATQVFGDFLGEHHSEVVIVHDAWKRHAPAITPISKPSHGRISMRVEIKPRRLYISDSVFRAWCLKRTISYRATVEALRQEKVIIGPTRNRTLTAGTEIPGAQVFVLEVNLDHEVMGSFAQSVQAAQGANVYALPPRV